MGSRNVFTLTDTENHPILMHCLRGKIPCSCIVGCYRKVQKWSLTSVYDEYERFVGSLRPLDIQFLELFDFSNAARTEENHHDEKGTKTQALLRKI